VLAVEAAHGSWTSTEKEMRSATWFSENCLLLSGPLLAIVMTLVKYRLTVPLFDRFDELT